MRTYELLSSVLDQIENDMDDKLDMDGLAAASALSSVHLQRIFKFAFGLPLAGYIRSRRLSASVERLLKTDLNVLDVAQEYGFAYEQTYIRAFNGIASHSVNQKVDHCYSKRAPHERCPFCISLGCLVTTR